MLGFDVSERTISRWLRRTRRDPEPARRWLTFLRNHREAIAAMVFVTVPTIAFSVLYCFFVISHDRRRILHFNVTKHPTSPWMVASFLTCGWEGCTTGTIGLPNPSRRSVAKTSGSSILKYTGTPRGRSPERILSLGGEGIIWMGQPSRPGIALFSV